jgi:RNA polymerase sigma-70 factor (ECF subfamily)
MLRRLGWTQRYISATDASRPNGISRRLLSDLQERDPPRMSADAPELSRGERPQAESTASDLLAAAKRMDSQAWQELVERYSWLIVRWCQQEGLDDDDCPDVTQAVFAKVAAHLADFEKDGRTAAFRRWLRSITRSQIAEFRRRAAKQPHAVGGSSARQRILDIPAREPRSSIDSRLNALVDRFWVLVERIEETLDVTTWQSFWLTTFEGLKSTEVAALLGMTPAAVRLAKARVLRRLREEDAGLTEELRSTKGKISEAN